MTDVRSRIVEAAAELLTREGRDAVSTRAVSAAAGVQAPAIYRQFGDMRALLHAAAREVLARYVRDKQTLEPAADPLEELRRGWDMHVAFGLANPAAYQLMYADGETSAEARAGHAVLVTRVAPLAAEGRLRVSVEHAANMIYAAACGVVLSLIGTAPAERDPELSASMRDAVLEAITLPKSSLRLATVLSPGERQLLGEWTARLTRRRSRP